MAVTVEYRSGQQETNDNAVSIAVKDGHLFGMNIDGHVVLAVAPGVWTQAEVKSDNTSRS